MLKHPGEGFFNESGFEFFKHLVFWGVIGFFLGSCFGYFNAVSPHTLMVI